MSFKDGVFNDVHGVFLNTDEFAEMRSVYYDDELYADIPVVLTGPKETARTQRREDHAEGLYAVRPVMHCALSDMGGRQPEKGARIAINERAGTDGFYRQYYILASDCEMGMLRLELEAIDE